MVSCPHPRHPPPGRLHVPYPQHLHHNAAALCCCREHCAGLNVARGGPFWPFSGPLSSPVGRGHTCRPFGPFRVHFHLRLVEGTPADHEATCVLHEAPGSAQSATERSLSPMDVPLGVGLQDSGSKGKSRVCCNQANRCVCVRCGPKMLGHAGCRAQFSVSEVTHSKWWHLLLIRGIRINVYGSLRPQVQKKHNTVTAKVVEIRGSTVVGTPTCNMFSIKCPKALWTIPLVENLLMYLPVLLLCVWNLDTPGTKIIILLWSAK